MEHVKPLRAYTFKHKDTGELLTLKHGRVVNSATGEVEQGVTSQRYALVGRKIPMPVRSDTWFQGFDFSTMKLWLENAGYEHEASVNMLTGEVKIVRKPVHVDENKLKFVDDIIIELMKGSNRASAARVYSIAYGCDIAKALQAVDDLEKDC